MVNKGGRPPYMPSAKDRNMVQVMAGHAIHQDTIACALGITGPTLRKHFRDELSRSAALVEAQLSVGQFERAKGKDGVAQRACEFILQTRFGWSKPEVFKHEVAGKDGTPIQHSIAIEWVSANPMEKA